MVLLQADTRATRKNNIAVLLMIFTYFFSFMGRRKLLNDMCHHLDLETPCHALSADLNNATFMVSRGLYFTITRFPAEYFSSDPSAIIACVSA